MVVSICRGTFDSPSVPVPPPGVSDLWISPLSLTAPHPHFNLFPFIPIYFSYQPLINRPLPVSELLQRSQRSRRDGATRLLSGFSPGLQADATGSQKGQNLFKPPPPRSLLSLKHAALIKMQLHVHTDAAQSGLFPRRRSESLCSLSGASSLLINEVIFTFPDLPSLNLPAQPGYFPPTLAAVFPSRVPSIAGSTHDSKLTATMLTSQPVKPMKAAERSRGR